MELTEQEKREREKSVAEAHDGLSLGLFATALIAYSVTDSLWWIAGVVLGVFFALSSICLALLNRWIPKRILMTATGVKIKHVSWFLGFTALGIGLVQAGWGFWWGILCICIAYLILGFGIGEGVGTVIKEIIKNLSKAKK